LGRWDINLDADIHRDDIRPRVVGEKIDPHAAGGDEIGADAGDILGIHGDPLGTDAVVGHHHHNRLFADRVMHLAGDSGDLPGDILQLAEAARRLEAVVDLLLGGGHDRPVDGPDRFQGLFEQMHDGLPVVETDENGHSPMNSISLRVALSTLNFQ
jgi:hypothetical protein